MACEAATLPFIIGEKAVSGCDDVLAMPAINS